MISRKSTTVIAHIYGLLAIEAPTSFHSSGTWTVESLCRFFYDEDYPEWFIKRFQELESPDALDDFVRSLQTGSSVKNSFFTYHEDALAEGQSILKKLAINVFTFDFNEDHRDIGLMNNLVEVLKRQLELDGYVNKNGQLLPIEHSVLNEQEEQSYLEELIDNSTLGDKAVIKHHLGLTERAYVDSRWSDTISNARNFFESILKQIAEGAHIKINGTPLTLRRPADIRDYLETTSLIDRTEKDAIARVYGLISNTGSHPNMAHQDQARLMRNLALTFSQYILLQWAGYLKANP